VAVLGWIFVAGLVIIWGIFLLPVGRFGASGSSVEEFERSMDLLAETQRRGPGRWVVMPRKGAPIRDFRDLSKARIRRRRRRILAGLAEVSGLFILMGLFPPLHAMLVPGVVLLGLLFGYTVLLARVKAVESERARAAAARRARAAEAEPEPVAALRAAAPEPALAAVAAPAIDDLAFIEDDCHVIVRRSDEIDMEELRAEVAAAAR
jgi:hypothetical protein